MLMSRRRPPRSRPRRRRTVAINRRCCRCSGHGAKARGSARARARASGGGECARLGARRPRLQAAAPALLHAACPAKGVHVTRGPRRPIGRRRGRRPSSASRRRSRPTSSRSACGSSSAACIGSLARSLPPRLHSRRCVAHQRRSFRSRHARSYSSASSSSASRGAHCRSSRRWASITSSCSLSCWSAIIITSARSSRSFL
mmetsp:Transcript_100681/g.290936  ORF Transcript_100681/g.290936 Transcript_100681/m.290936 type:complete len:201 (-) Transcript_100681:408-1010(-)